MQAEFLRVSAVLLASALAFGACRRGQQAANASGCGDQDECEDLLDECMEEHDADDLDDIRESSQSCVAAGNASLQRHDLSVAVPAFGRACKLGNREGCDGLAQAGLKLHHGAGLRKDDKAAFGLFHLGCDGRSGSACFNLGYMYERGIGVTKHADYAAFAYRRACDNDDAYGCYNLAIMKLGDAGVKADRPGAVALFRQSCTEGHVDGCIRLGGHLERGDGVDKDALEAASLYDALCRSGDEAGCKKLATLAARNPAAGRFLADQQRQREAARPADQPRQHEADESKRRQANATKRAEQDRRRAEAAAQQRLVQLCYDHECNGVKSGRRCFDSKQDYCRSLCAERDCVSQMVCKRECR